MPNLTKRTIPHSILVSYCSKVATTGFMTRVWKEFRHYCTSAWHHCVRAYSAVAVECCLQYLETKTTHWLTDMVAKITEGFQNLFTVTGAGGSETTVGWLETWGASSIHTCVSSTEECRVCWCFFSYILINEICECVWDWGRTWTGEWRDSGVSGALGMYLVWGKGARGRKGSGVRWESWWWWWMAQGYTEGSGRRSGGE